MAGASVLEEFRLLLLADAALFQAIDYLRQLRLPGCTDQTQLVRVELARQIERLQPAAYRQMAEQPQHASPSKGARGAPHEPS